MRPGSKLLFAAFLCLLAASMSADADESYVAPRAPDGHPDLQGIWQARNTAAYDLEDHAPSYGIPAGAGVVVEGRIPYQPWAAEQRRQNFIDRRTADPVAACYLAGVPRVTYMPFPLQIFQGPDYVTIISEYAHTTRFIPTNGSEHIRDVEFWMGDSRGQWEGDTLVVDVTSFTGNTWFDASGNFHSADLHVVERYTRTARDVLTYEVTVTDPTVFTEPWHIRTTLHRRDEPGLQILEYSCYAYAEEEGLRRLGTHPEDRGSAAGD